MSIVLASGATDVNGRQSCLASGATDVNGPQS
jgi:hypothetical protein